MIGSDWLNLCHFYLSLLYNQIIAVQLIDLFDTKESETNWCSRIVTNYYEFIPLLRFCNDTMCSIASFYNPIKSNHILCSIPNVQKMAAGAAGLFSNINLKKPHKFDK